MIQLIAFTIGILILIGVFLALRSVVLWYWKVDTAVKNQETTIRVLVQINNTLEDIERHLRDGNSTQNLETEAHEHS